MLRKADIKDLNACLSLFEQSVKTLCAKDYTKDQICAWIKIDRQQWEEKFKYDEIFVYEKRGKIASFISVKQEQKLLDLLFTHPDFVRQGVGGKIKCRKRKIKCRIFATNYLSFNLKLKL